MKKHFGKFSLILLFFLLFSMQVSGEINVPPKPVANIYVQDLAGILSPETEQSILNIGSELDQKTTAQLAVVTIDSLQENSVEEYALALFRGWGIGSKEKNNGVLILVAPNERVSRIEVGYGLEGALPDGKTGRIQDEYMIPYFQQGDYDSGILNGYMAAAQIIAGEYQVELSGNYTGNAVPVQETPQPVPRWLAFLIVIGIGFLLFLDFKFFGGMITWFLLSSLRRGGGGGRGGFGGGGFGGGSSGGGGSSRNW